MDDLKVELFFFCLSQPFDDSEATEVLVENPVTSSLCYSIISVIIHMDASMTNSLCVKRGKKKCVTQIQISCIQINPLIGSKTKAGQKVASQAKTDPWLHSTPPPRHRPHLSNSLVHTGQTRNAGYTLLINQGKGSSKYNGGEKGGFYLKK